ncbi:GNAT family N-acetyltransferase [Paraburkholderia caballeronis]|uniref:L-ornithine N(alpha)-acyltransferase n=1 Tax=Paraburkholderia caballeronis TaxID=416943 RepID=A0A1H7MNU0_9BURK|nr:GNAT family N-acyltransferase [Paraburkholderia caballeronis]PXW26493.1 ornithine-acyl[acyl carrier protein] N-acyltransferase [Paraburkholderia caballeronis]PXX02040.1 ornithine-acyl[acyl carrier protein] N-acyltransferase [Paraburkholderia caballeronis]RAK01197.1 ornithine-acyl[acyl carrier protein] N-acyltransferase [Paraburkholderia caballeronis]TDV16238.1 ornithine-acyl[acyl carrier protein] N-acyltransferase [Paraburkholderia caballeronis]TDV20588.1 ornithine-acyl[acyl carrier protein
MRDLPTPTPPLVSNPFESHRRLPRAAETVTAQHRLQVAWARTDEELREAQRLRYRVFAEEMGARLTGPAGLDVDTFDHYCDHLLVRDLDTLKVVGTYRVLPPHEALRAGRLYAESEFDVSRLAHLRPKMVEVGRSCVHPDYRSGSVIMSLWGGLGAYMTYNGYETMLGCASVAMADGGHYAANLYCSLDASALTDPEYRAFPHTPLPVDELRTGTTAVPPPLIKGYLRLGAKICGAPAWDPDFNTADFLTLFRLSEINARYARHFLADA